MKFSNIMVATAILAFVASVNAEATSAEDCQMDYWRLTEDLTLTTAQKCEALVVFSKCLGQFDADEGKESLLFQKNSKTCESYWKNDEPPSVRASRDNMVMTVDNAKDIEFHRHRRETISVFTMNEKITDLLATVEDLKAQLVSSAAATAKDLQGKLDAKSDELDRKSRELADAFDDKSKAIDQTVADLESKVDDSVKSTDKQLTDAKKATDTQLNDAKKTTDKQLADAKTEAKENMDALAKKIGESVDTKLKPGSKVIASLANTYHSNPKIPVFRVGKWHTYSNHYSWLDGNRPNGYGGIHPSTWTDGRAKADQMSNDFKYLQRLFTRKATASTFGGTICSEVYGQRSSTTGGVCGAIFRIKNTGKSSIGWNPRLTMTSWHGWGEEASISLNGNRQYSGNCENECHFNQQFSIPANSAGNRVSTVIFISTSSHDNGHYNQWRTTVLLFGDNSLALPDGLEYVDDLDTVTGAWKK